jgi:hypothetical protein
MLFSGTGTCNTSLQIVPGCFKSLCATGTLQQVSFNTPTHSKHSPSLHPGIHFTQAYTSPRHKAPPYPGTGVYTQSTTPPSLHPGTGMYTQSTTSPSLHPGTGPYTQSTTTPSLHPGTGPVHSKHHHTLTRSTQALVQYTQSTTTPSLHPGTGPVHSKHHHTLTPPRH